MSNLQKYVANSTVLGAMREGLRRGKTKKAWAKLATKKTYRPVPDRTRRAILGATLGAPAAATGALAAGLLTRNPMVLKRVLQATAVGGGLGAVLGQGLGINRDANSGRLRLRRGTKGRVKGKLIFARDGEDV